MSEPNKKTNAENGEEKTPAKKTGGKPAPKEEKPGIVQRFKGWWKRNWKYVATAGGGVVVGAGAAYGAGKLGESMAARKSASHQDDDE